MRKLILLAITLLFSSFILFSPTVSAVNVFSSTCGTGASGSTAVCKSVQTQQSTNSNPILVILKTVISVLSYIIGVASVIVIIIAAFQFITAGGDQQSIVNARNMLIYALVGVAVAVLAQTIVIFVLSNVG